GRARRAIEILRRAEETPWTVASRDAQYVTIRSLCRGCHEDFGSPNSLPIQKPDSWQSCGRCHPAVYDEWKGSLHEGAWRDPVYRMSAGNPPKLECRGCHSME